MQWRRQELRQEGHCLLSPLQRVTPSVAFPLLPAQATHKASHGSALNFQWFVVTLLSSFKQMSKYTKKKHGHHWIPYTPQVPISSDATECIMTVYMRTASFW